MTQRAISERAIPERAVSVPTRLLLLTPHLGGGGSEKVIAMLAQSLPAAKYDVHLGLITQRSTEASDFPDQVTVHGLGVRRIRSAALPLLRLVRQLKPAVVLSSMFHLNFMVLLLRPLFPAGTRVVIRHNGALAASLAQDALPGYTRLLYQLLYPRAAMILCQSDAMAEELSGLLGIKPQRLAVLPNPVEVDEIRARVIAQPSVWLGGGPRLLAVGRLSQEKGFDLLLHALAAVLPQYPGAILLIAGNGPEAANLKLIARHLAIETAVHFAGHVDEPSLFFSGATAFVLPSRHDAMPNALLEAAAAGLPLVATPASAGLEALLRDQPGVWLAAGTSSQAVTTALLSALDVLAPGQRYQHAFIDAFRLQRAIPRYESVIDALLEPGRTSKPTEGRRT